MGTTLKVVVRTTILLVLGVIGYFVFDQYDGQRRIGELCNTDGGLRSYGRARARGVLMGDQVNGPRCTACAEWLASDIYDYVDVHIPPESGLAYGSTADTEYYRYSIAPAGNAECILQKPSLSSQVRFTQREDELRAGIAPTRCLVLAGVTRSTL